MDCRKFGDGTGRWGFRGSFYAAVIFIVMGVWGGAVAQSGNAAGVIDLAQTMTAGNFPLETEENTYSWVYRVNDSTAIDDTRFNCSGNDPCYVIKGDVTVKGSLNTHRARIIVGSNATVTFEGASMSGLGGSRDGITIADNTTVTITLKDGTTSSITGSRNGISIGSDAKLTINGDGSLTTNTIFGITASNFTVNGEKVIVQSTTAAGYTAANNLTRGMLIVGSGNSTAYNLQGDVTLPGAFSIPSGHTLTIPDGAKLTVPANMTLTISGTLVTGAGSGWGGELYVAGSVAGSGKITNNGKIDNTSATGTIANTIAVTTATGALFDRKPQGTSPSIVAASETVDLNNIKFGDSNFSLKLSGVDNPGVGETFARLEGTAATVSSVGLVTISSAGEIKVIGRKAGTNNYNPCSTDVTINIQKRSLGDSVITYTIPSFTYNGEAQCPTAGSNFIVRDSRKSVNLSATADYEVGGCTNNTNATDATNIATVLITAREGSTNYTGSFNAPFVINRANVSSGVTMDLTVDGESATTVPYKGSAYQLGTGLRRSGDTIDPSYYDIVCVRGGVTDSSCSDTTRTHAGTVTVRAVFKGNYTGSVEKSFSISKKAITLDAENSSFPGKVYDGSASVLDTSEIRVAFNGLVGSDELRNMEDFTISRALYNNANAGERTASATITLEADGPRSRNYTLSGTLSGVPAEITKADPDTSQFSFTIPTNHRYAGVARGIGTPTVKSGVSGMGTTRRVLYNGSDSLPVDVGTYRVTLNISEGTNYNAATIELGDYEIGEPLPPEITVYLNNITVRMEDTTTGAFRVSATSPNNGSLRYTWFDANRDTVAGATSATFRPNVDSLGPGTYTYSVIVTNRVAVGTGAEVASAEGGIASVEVLPPATPITGATVVIRGEYVYTGSAIVLHRDSVTVTMANGTVLRGDSLDYRIDYSNNTDAGTASLTIVGVDDYKGTIPRTFVIGKSPLDISDIAPPVLSTVYNGEAQPIEIVPTSRRTGLGVATIKYNGSTTPPVDAGIYEVTLWSIAAGANFLAFTPEDSIPLGNYTISKKTPVIDDVIFDSLVNVPWTGEPYDIGDVTLKGTGYDSLTVRYNGSDSLPVDMGVYIVTVSIAGGINYNSATLTLGEFEIFDPTSVASGNREVVDVVGGGVSVVAPVGTLAAKVTVGPNPVGKAGAVNFYRTGALISGGSLTVYDAAGSVVRKIAVSEESAAVYGSGSRVIGSWDLRDASGRAVGVGTYLVRGSIKTSGGKAERVSILVGVRQ